MPPKRVQVKRQATIQNLTPEVVAKRKKRHLDELERTNYAEAGHDGDEDGPEYSKGRGRQTISDKQRMKLPGKSPAATAKRSTMKVRTAILYRKNFATLLDESRIASLPPDVPTYLTANAPAPTRPPRMLCSVCGYWGSHKCVRCSMPFCNRNCQGVHEETRCMV